MPTEAVQLALVNSLPMILTGLAALVSAIAAAWRTGSAVKASIAAQKASETVQTEFGSLKVTVNGTLAKMLEALTAAARAETKAAHAEGLVEGALQAPPAVVAAPPSPAPPPAAPPRDTGGRRLIDKPPSGGT